mmetsp:Transcript_150542/g.484029  ORF Transcript_150542/g.484029 Transcript_150542/m.484029 type:complete len:317 (+) Transcript_150542:5341-6291(+)
MHLSSVCQIIIVVRIFQLFVNLCNVLRFLVNACIDRSKVVTPQHLVPNFRVDFKDAEPRFEQLASRFGEPVFVLVTNQPVAEDSREFMVPQPRPSFRIRHMHGFHHEQALEDLGNITQVEGVVRPRWCRQQLFATLVVQLDGATDGSVGQTLNLLFELLQEASDDGPENGVHGFLARRGHAQHMRMPGEARGHRIPASSWRGCAEQQSHVFDVLPLEFFAVEEAALVLALPQQLNGRLRAILFNKRHVNIIDEDHDRFVHWCAQQSLALLVEFPLNGHLCLVSFCLGAECHVHWHDAGEFLHLLQQVRYVDALADT